MLRIPDCSWAVTTMKYANLYTQKLYNYNYNMQL